MNASRDGEIDSHSALRRRAKDFPNAGGKRMTNRVITNVESEKLYLVSLSPVASTEDRRCMDRRCMDRWGEGFDALVAQTRKPTAAMGRRANQVS